MKIPKRIMLIFSVILSVFMFCSCSSKPSSENTEIKDHSVTEEASVNEQNESESKKDEEKKEEAAESFSYLHLMSGSDYLDDWRDMYLYSNAAWEFVKLTDEDAEKYPKLQEKLSSIRMEEETRAKEFIDEWSDLYTDGEYMDDYYQVITNERKVFVQRADNSILSLRVDDYSHTGGAHPMYGAGGVNLDPVTGEELTLADIMTDTSNLSSLLAERLNEKYAEELFEDPSIILAEYDLDRFNWTMGYQGITFYFIPYELAPYAAGQLEVHFWFDKDADLFKKEYIQTPPNGYFVEAPSSFLFDLNPEDDHKDEIKVFEMVGSEWGDKYLDICINDQSYSDTGDYGYSFYSYFAHLKNGKNYLYVIGYSDNDYAILYIYDMNGSSPSLAEAKFGMDLLNIWEDDSEYGTSYTLLPADPDRVSFDHRIEIIGTMTASQEYSFDTENGIPVMVDDWYEIRDREIDVTALKEVSVWMLDEEQEVILPAGTVLYVVRTDNETYVDFRLEDGRECRIQVDNREWPAKIYGEAVEEWFDGIVYAG